MPGQLSEKLLANWPVVLVISALAVVAIGVLWLLLPRRVERSLHWVDTYLLPGDFCNLYRPVSFVLLVMASAVILFIAGHTIAAYLGFDTSATGSALETWAVAALQWLLARLARILLVVALSWVIIRVIAHSTPALVSKYLGRRAGEAADAGELEKRTKTLSAVLQRTSTFFVLAVALLVVLSEIGVNIAPLLAGAGVAGIAIGFAAQNIIRDFLSGIFILLEDQYRVGDVVNVAGIGGLVEDINLRRTVLRDLDFVVHNIPNGEIRTASNLTKEKSRANLNIEVAYKEDLDRVIAVLNRIGQEMYDDPAFGPLMNEPLKVLRVDAFRDSGIAIKVLGETKPIQQWTIMGEYRRRVKKVFDEEGIEIPFPHRTIYWGKNVETVVRPVDNGRQAGDAQAGGPSAAGDQSEKTGGGQRRD
ncbi:MAG: mechanosensitive ion channel family protein [Chloroflexi bacterium]|nr:mechanosensitive ion channel family protein [Chloroflexota bacterium]